MTSQKPPQRPEGKLIEVAALADGRSIRQLAPLIGLSDTRWRQLVQGAQPAGPGRYAEAVARAEILAKMAQLLRITPAQLREVGRADAAAVLERLLDTSTPDADRLGPAPASFVPDAVNRAIQLIYEAPNLSAGDKLWAIRRVLELNAEMQAEKTARGIDPQTGESAVARPQLTNGS